MAGHVAGFDRFRGAAAAIMALALRSERVPQLVLECEARLGHVFVNRHPFVIGNPDRVEAADIVDELLIGFFAIELRDKVPKNLSQVMNTPA